MRHPSGEIAAGALAAQHDRQPACRRRTFEHRQRIVEGGRMQMFRRQPVVGRQHGKAGTGANLGADVVMAVETAKHEAAAVIVDDHRLRRLARQLVAPDRDRLIAGGNRAVAGFDACGSACVECPAHRVIDRPLLVDRQIHFGRIPCVDPVDIGPQRRVEQRRVFFPFCFFGLFRVTDHRHAGPPWKRQSSSYSRAAFS